MDSMWCPILFAALAVILFSSPALADRKFGKQLCFILLSLFFQQQPLVRRVYPHLSASQTVRGDKSTCLSRVGWVVYTNIAKVILNCSLFFIVFQSAYRIFLAVSRGCSLV